MLVHFEEEQRREAAESRRKPTGANLFGALGRLPLPTCVTAPRSHPLRAGRAGYCAPPSGFGGGSEQTLLMHVLPPGALQQSAVVVHLLPSGEQPDA